MNWGEKKEKRAELSPPKLRWPSWHFFFSSKETSLTSNDDKLAYTHNAQRVNCNGGGDPAACLYFLPSVFGIQHYPFYFSIYACIYIHF